MKKSIGILLGAVFCAGWIAGIVFSQGTGSLWTFPVELKVDFGVSGKPPWTGVLKVDGKTTPKDAVSLVFPVQSGKVCSSLHDVLGIGGVLTDATQNLWWICAVNGSRKVSAYQTRLKPGDRVEWSYRRETKEDQAPKRRKP